MTLDIDAIEARANAATPGPWGIMALHDLLRFGRKNGGGWDQYEEIMPVDGDEEFIISARQDVPALCAEVRELRAANEQLTNELAAARENHIDANKRNMTANERADRAEAAMEQARALLAELAGCGYECQAGALENNQAYRDLAALLAAAPGGAA